MSNDKNTKLFSGEVVAKFNKNTVTVLVSRVKANPLYRKKYTVSKKYQADCTKEVKIGDIVEIAPSIPISKYKKYKVVGIKV